MFLGCARLEQSAAIILNYTLKGNCISHAIKINFAGQYYVKLFDEQNLQR